MKARTLARMTILICCARRGTADGRTFQSETTIPAQEPVRIERQAAQPSVAPPHYSAVVLPGYWSDRYPNFYLSSGWAISSAFGAGSFESRNGSLHAALFDLQGRSYQDLGILPGDTGSVAFAVNETGQAAGVSYSVSTAHAVIFSDGMVVQIPNLPYFGDRKAYASALGINDRGVVVGSAGLWDIADRHGFVYDHGVLTDLGTASPTAINRQGTICGSHGGRAFKLTGDTLHDLGTLPGDTLSNARGINDSGFIVGHSLNTTTSVMRAFLYHGKMEALPSLANDIATLALSINKRGDIVGYGYDSANRWHGVIWVDGQIHDLNSLVPTGTPHVSAAYGINDAGQIITDSLLLTPVAGTKGEAATFR